MIIQNALVLPNPESPFTNGHAIVSDEALPTYSGHVHKAHEAFPGKWVYPFPSARSAASALERIQAIRNERSAGVQQ